MKQRTLALVAICICMPAAFAAAEEAGLMKPEKPYAFMERTYLSPLSPFGKDLILEGQVSTHYFFINNLGDLPWQREGGNRWTLSASILLTVRIYDDFSSPVRTPSFMVRPVYLQRLFLRRKDDTFRLIECAVGLMHHSNGQSGCTFLGMEYDPDTDDCVVTDPALYALRIANTLDGSFSTNYIPLHAGVRWGRLDNNAAVTRQVSLEGFGEIHPEGFLKGGLAPDLAAEYGQVMAGLGITGEWCRPDRGALRVALYQQARFGPDKPDTDWSGQLEMSHVWYGAGDVGAFVRFHWGNDYYNIRFQDVDSFVSVGLIWDPSRLDQFHPARRQRVP